MNKRVRTGIVAGVAAAVVGVGGFAVGAAATDTSEPEQDQTTTSLKDDEARGERPDHQGPEGSQDDAKGPEGEGKGGPEGGHGPHGPRGGGEGPGESPDGKGSQDGQKSSGDDC